MARAPRTPAGRFESAWLTLQSCLEQCWRDQHGGPTDDAPPVYELLTWARRRSILTIDVEDFLHKCRKVRNVYAHVAFPEYDGPVATPHQQVVSRLEKLVGALRHPLRVGDIAAKALACLPTTPLRDALRMMHPRRLLAVAVSA